MVHARPRGTLCLRSTAAASTEAADDVTNTDAPPPAPHALSLQQVEDEGHCLPLQAAWHYLPLLQDLQRLCRLLRIRPANPDEAAEEGEDFAAVATLFVSRRDCRRARGLWHKEERENASVDVNASTKGDGGGEDGSGRWARAAEGSCGGAEAQRGGREGGV